MTADPKQPTEPTDRPCPRCSARLFEGRSSQLTLLGCGTCGGVWLSNEQSQSLVERLDRAVLDLSDRAAVVARGKVLDGAATAYCPYDRLPLARVSVRGVTLDVCEAHGTWFDAGEVRRVASAYHHQRVAFAPAPRPAATALEPTPTYASSSVLDAPSSPSAGPTLWDFLSVVSASSSSSSSSSITWSSDTSSPTSSWLDSLGSSSSSDSGGSWGGGGGDFGGGGSSSDY